MPEWLSKNSVAIVLQKLSFSGVKPAKNNTQNRALLLILMKGEMRGALKRIETQGQLSLAFCLSAEGFAYMPESTVLELKQPSQNNTNTYTWNEWPTSTQLYEGLASEWLFGLWKQKKATYCWRLCQHIPEQSIVSESLRWVRLKMHTAGKIDTRCTIMCAVMKSLSNALWCQYLKINNSIKISRPNGWQNVCQAGLPQSKQNVTVVFPCNCIFDDDIKNKAIENNFYHIGISKTCDERLLYLDTF